MARKTETIVTLTDDLDGGKADRTIAFAVNGTAYEIDLSKRNAAAFDKLIAPYVQAARKAPRVSRSRGGASTGARSTRSRDDLAEIRAWAKQQGIAVSERGRIAGTVIEAYDAGH